MKKKAKRVSRRVAKNPPIGFPSENRDIRSLRLSLSRSLLSGDVAQLKHSAFQFGNANLFGIENVSPELASALQATADHIASAGSIPEYRAFLREVPVRSGQLPASTAMWASGAAVDHTVGPFVSTDGRRVWFDFFKIERLIALYIQEMADPALIFKVNLQARIPDPLLPAITDALTFYNLPASSIWINSQVLASDAPAGVYNGLSISGGEIALSAKPLLASGKLTIAADTIVRVKLDLQQPALDGDDSSSYGSDARSAELKLPDQFSFHFSGQGHGVDSVGSASWNIYGDEGDFGWDRGATATYDPGLRHTLLPFRKSGNIFSAAECHSPFFTLQGEAPVVASAWAIPAASLDIVNPTPAAGIGGLLIRTKAGLTSRWSGLQGGKLSLVAPSILAEPGRLEITDQQASNRFCSQRFELWEDAQNPFGTTLDVRYLALTPIVYNSSAAGDEVLFVVVNGEVKIDRPVTVAGDAIPIHTSNSMLVVAASNKSRFLYFFDNNILVDTATVDVSYVGSVPSIALALHNALFKVTPVNGCALFGTLSTDFVAVSNGFLFLTFGLYGYVPTLPDPYAAQLAGLQFQFRESRGNLRTGGQVWLLLICQIQWSPAAAAVPDNNSVDDVVVSFHFAPLNNEYQSALTAATFDAGTSGGSSNPDSASIGGFSTRVLLDTLPDYGRLWDKQTQSLRQDVFALLDVSTNADLMGVSFGSFGERGTLALLTTHVAVAKGQATSFPLQIQGMDVVSQGSNVRAFTVPQISWEPVLNLSEHHVPGDPQLGPNYYPNDGGPTRVFNNSADQVTLAPIPLTNFLVDSNEHDDNFAALALFTLPFGLKALALLRNQYVHGGSNRRGASLRNEPKSFRKDLRTALQLQMNAGEALFPDQSDMFMGSTVQLNNVLRLDGTPDGSSTLGGDVTKIFNGEFFDPSSLIQDRGVPLTRIDLSGYGASTFSNWLNPKASIAETSQARFDVFVGRCSHEVIQVKSIMYPWGIHVVRTITLFRAGSGYAYRYDSGWKAEGDGLFDFTYFAHPAPGKDAESRQAGYEIHPGIITGLFNIQNIQDTPSVLPFKGQYDLLAGAKYVDKDGIEQTASGKKAIDYELQPVFFDADIAIENPVSGFRSITTGGGKSRKVVASKGILGFVQLAPRGMPLTTTTFHDLVARQGTIGGALDCVVDLNLSGQQVRVRGFDFSNSVGANGTDPIFVASPRGTTVLPKDGSWTLVQHLNGTGEVNPVAKEMSVPIVRIGKLVKIGEEMLLDPAPGSQLVRIAEPSEILRAPVAATINYGFLQSTDTQKALFLTPSYAAGISKMLSKTPPLFADAFRIVNSKSIFPNAGNAVNAFGDVINLAVKGTEFVKNALTDAGNQVFEVMQLDQVTAGVKQQGFQLLKKQPTFDLPSNSKTLIELGGAFKIYIEYQADGVKTASGPESLLGSLDYDVNSFATNVNDTWKSHMSNVAIVVDLGPIQRLMTIKGNWNANKGSEAAYAGGADFPTPQIEFASELNPIIQILQILEDLQTANYKDAFQNGLRLAMSNKAGSWEYKFEASKEIPVLRFPTPDFIYNDPNTPLKLDAGLKLGAYFNAGLKVTTDANQLLPTAGAYLGFYGRLSVMCVSLSVATVYAVGQANLDIGADTLTGPNLHMKFGFGAQIVVGLPVVGNVSVLYMVGVEIFIDSTKLQVSAFLLFQGHAELLAGLVGVTITIEAKGTVSRANDRTDLAAQVTFGLDISIFLVIDISFSTSWQEQRQIA